MARKQASPGSRKWQPPAPLQETPDSEQFPVRQGTGEYKVGPGNPRSSIGFSPGNPATPMVHPGTGPT